jgi:hypothetical protein
MSHIYRIRQFLQNSFILSFIFIYTSISIVLWIFSSVCYIFLFSFIGKYLWWYFLMICSVGILCILIIIFVIDIVLGD